jgi:hypothetical protein
MADFIIVIATAAALAAPAAPGAAAPAPAAPTAPAASSATLNAPTLGFRTYPDAASCEQAAATVAAPPNARLVCVPVEPHLGEMANAY